MSRQLYTAVYLGRLGYVYWGSRSERTRAVELRNVHDCKGQLIFEANKTRFTDRWHNNLKTNDIVQFKAERHVNKLMYVTGVKVIGHL